MKVVPAISLLLLLLVLLLTITQKDGEHLSRARMTTRSATARQRRVQTALRTPQTEMPQDVLRRIYTDVISRDEREVRQNERNRRQQVLTELQRYVTWREIKRRLIAERDQVQTGSHDFSQTESDLIDYMYTHEQNKIWNFWFETGIKIYPSIDWMTDVGWEMEIEPRTLPMVGAPGYMVHNRARYDFDPVHPEGKSNFFPWFLPWADRQNHDQMYGIF